MTAQKADWMEKLAACAEVDAEGWGRCSGLDFREAKELLDWLEVRGFAQREATLDAAQRVTVRWHR